MIPFNKLVIVLWFSTLFSTVKPDCEKISARSAVCLRQNYTEIPNIFEQGIEDLILPYNNFTELKSCNLEQYQSVRYLNLDYNGISTTHRMKAIHVLKNLERLSISGNVIQSFDFRIFAKNTHLKEINASDNKDMFIKENCVSLPELERLILNGNNIKELPTKVLKCFPKLRYLDMRTNNLHSLPSNMEEILPQLEKILLSNNPLRVEELSSFVFERSDLSYVKGTQNNFDVKDKLILKKDTECSESNGYGNNSGAVFAAITLAFAALALSVFMTVIIIYFRNK